MNIDCVYEERNNSSFSFEKSSQGFLRRNSVVESLFRAKNAEKVFYGGGAMTGKRPMTVHFPVVPKALRKKQSEFEAEAVPHMDILYNFALRTTGNADDAQDLLQETLLKAYRFWDKYEKGTNIRAWLFRIMKNSYINRYRKEMREPGMVDYDDVENFYDSIRDDSTDTNDLQKKLYSNMLSDEVTKALQSLPEDFRTVVILCDIEGLTYEEIAEFLNCPIGTVRSRLHRGRKMLQEKLFDYARERGLFGDEDSLD